MQSSTMHMKFYVQFMSFIIIALSVLSFYGNCSIYKTERPSLNRFLNYGFKKYKPSLGLRNEIIKSKVAVLGDILKQHVEKLRKVPGQSVELVFLVDASASVGAENFFSELKFVKKLLADFVVSYNHTRVAVITFSSSSKVIRHIDHVTHASEKNHKCSLLERELPKIRYSGGGTYTLGALLEAQGVLAISRWNAVKAVFLVTDGYSNGGDPRPAAQFLKDKGVIIFTFGIKNGNIQELYDMASHPKEEHSYILDSFQEFEALARRALHQDLQDDVIVDQQEHECNALCPKGFGCCDKNAYCTCGAHTGLYACTCRKGYYGTGLKKDCRPCPVGTYRDFEAPGDVTTCTTCPDKHMTSNEGSTSLFHCFCRKGYTQTGLECEKKKCSQMNPPRNGYFVKDRCENVVNAACGIRCSPGYKLVGSSIRLCKENGNWSGTAAKCEMKTCPALKAPRHGIIFCSSEDQRIDSVCNFSCKPGYRLVGSRARTCLPVAMWDGIKPYCKPITCYPHLGIKNGIVTPSACTAKKVKYGTVCHLSCNSGYSLKGIQQTSCNAHGAWAGGGAQQCIDVDPPVIKCPSDVYATATKNENFADVTWDAPVAKDSSGGRVILSTKPVVSRPMQFKIGAHIIIYQAKDKWGNRANCSFTVTVIDKEPPRMDWCESPPTFLSKNAEVDVYWEEPLFSDNSGQVFIDRSMEPGKFKQGQTIVEYWAIDNSGNKATCNLTIKVQPHACEIPADPVNGAIICTDTDEAVMCTITCEDGYALAMSPTEDYFCAYDGIWMPLENPMPFPECSATSLSNTITHSGEMAISNDADEEGNSICNDIFLMNQLENRLEQRLEEALDEMCTEEVYCNVEVVEAICESIIADMEEDNNLIYSRKRRSITNDHVIRMLWSDPTSNYRYWIRGHPTEYQLVPDWVGLVPKKRVKRQFGFPAGMFEEEENTTISAEREEAKANFIGVLTSLILESLGNDIGMTRFSTFLSGLDSAEESYGFDDFLVSFAKTFGEDKAKSVRLLAEQKMGNFLKADSLKSSRKLSDKKSEDVSIITPDFEPLAEIYPPAGPLLDARLMEMASIQADEGASLVVHSESSQIPQKQSLKVKFRVQGQGLQSDETVKTAMSGLLSFAEKGHFDVDFGAQQLKVAAIRLSEDPEYSCDPGSVLYGKLCVKCSIGTFFNVITKTCQSCPSGSFQPKEGQVSCLVCPENTSTKSSQAKSGQDCKALCLPGSFSFDTLEPCTTCPIGNFQDEYASVKCVECPNGTTTWRRGSWVVEECKVPCALGHVSETGISPCLPCPVGSFQSKNSQTTCYSCPEGVSTNSTGSDSIHSCNGVSSDNEVSLSQLKTIQIDSCFSTPCENDGTCSALDFGYICHCPPGYSGEQCESEIDECLSEPCLNNGTCTDKLADFDCTCKDGFEGEICQIDINECESFPCKNNGSCLNLANAFKCICDSGYTGDVCDVNIDDCENLPCENGATCRDLINDFKCSCLPGYTGRTCEHDINECETDPCTHGACLDLVGNFSCACPIGYEGRFCETDINDCKNDTCLNEARCHDLINGFSCQCNPGYTGKRCDEELSTDFTMEMTNPGVMDYAKLDNLPVELQEVSVCFWMRTFDSNNYGTPFSYATHKSDNSLTLTDYSGFVFYINGKKEITDVSANDGNWHMICCTWQSNNGSWTIFKDAVMVDSGNGLARGQNISGKGAFVIGQEQDEIGGKYSPPESFIGEITLLNIWDVVLTEKKIKELFTTCERYVGNVKAWPDFQAGIMGHIKMKQSQFCRGCGVLQAPPNAKIIDNGSHSGVKLTVKCNTGYKIYKGDDERVCRIDGVWSGDTPECRAIYCGIPKPLYHGRTKAITYTYGDTIMYSCDNGYRLIGVASRKCLADGKWEGERPTCEMVTCPSPESIENAFLVSGLTSYLPTNKVTYSCNRGYQMDGPATRTCSRNGNWDGKGTECQPISCGKIPKIKNAKMSDNAEQEGWAGKPIVIDCSAGFVLEPQVQLECLNIGTWKRPFPKCVLPTCDKPPTVINGKVIVRASTTEREAFYKCEHGYVVAGEKTLRCTTNGTWDHPFSQCLLQPCPHPPEIVNGGVEKQEWRTGDKADYSCDEGYILAGESSLECTEGYMEGEWVGKVPSCEEIFCPRVDNIAGGVYTIHPPEVKHTFIVFPSEVESRHKREADFEMNNEAFPSIGIDAKDYSGMYEDELFNGGDSLQPFGVDDYSQISQSVDDLGQVAQPASFSDYFTSQSHGFDDPGQMTQSAGFSDYDFISQSHGFDDPGQMAQPADFGDYGVISQSQGFDNTDQMTQPASFADYDTVPQTHGFDDQPDQISQSIDGDNSITSQSQAYDDPGQISQPSDFNDYSFISQSQGFNAPGQIASPDDFGNYDHISQSQGFDDPGQMAQPADFSEYNQMTAQSQAGDDFGQISQTGVFDNYGAISQSEDFDDPGQVSQLSGLGDYDSSSQSQSYDNPGQISQSVGFDYYDGISHTDDIEQISQSSEFDDYDDISQLPDTDDTPAGYLAEKYPYNTTIRYKCAPGYKLLGSSVRRCSESGDWHEPEPRCYENFCPELLPVESGYLLYHGSGLNSKVEYNCHGGYQLIGDKELVCSASQKWIGTIPSCKHIDCGVPHEPENGTVAYSSTYFGSIATYECSEGFVFEGINERVCDGSGYWNGSTPRCTAITCDVPPVIKNGYITFEGSLYAGSPVEYMCKECFELIGAIVRKCQLDGSWSLEPPTCEKIYCESLPDKLDHGEVIGNSSECASLVEFECDPGYNLNGKKRSRCLESKRWSRKVPICEPVSCGRPPSVDNSIVSGRSYNFIDKIEYICNKGHTLSGSSSLTCNEYGEWSGDIPKCNIVSCEKPKGPSNGKVRLSGLSYQSYARIVCDPGFDLDGDDHLVCLETGQWDKELPYCIPTLCPAAAQPPNSFYNSSELYFESFSKLMYDCSAGYITDIIDTVMTCNSEGNWTGTLIDCNPIDCGQPIVPLKGSISFNESDDMPFAYNKEISYDCEIGYELIGDKIVVCLPTGNWSGFATCEQITCKHLETPKHTFESVATSDRHFGTSITYTCKDGYRLNGTSTVTCEANGIWSSRVPQCLPVKCPEPIEVFGAIVTGDVYEYNNNLHFKCLDGYTIKGSSVLICTANGKWSDEFPTCDMITCNDPVTIANGKWEKVSIHDMPVKTEPLDGYLKHSKLAKITQILEEQSESLLFTLNQHIVYSCDDGYHQLVNVTSRCTEEGWEPSQPVCNAITCPDPFKIRNGIALWYNVTYNSKINYKCNDGYELNGDSERHCQLNGLWSSVTPYCSPIMCPHPDNLLYGTMTGSSFHYNSVLSFKCDSGFDLTGSATRVCQVNGDWSGETPTCLEIFCGHPGNIPHAELDLTGFTVGNVATYSCKTGYKMKGKSSLTCLSDGKWDYKKPRCIQIDCGRPNSPKHGHTNGEVTSYNAKIQYSCKVGYKLVGPKESICLESGKWSYDLPSCEKITCSHPDIPAHSSITSDDDRLDSLEELDDNHSTKKKKWKKNKNRRKNKKGKNKSKKSRIVDHNYYVFDKITFQCEQGWHAEGETELSCTPEGVWSHDVPTCKRITCPVPSLPEEALYRGDDFSYGGNIEYYCSHGYFLKGNQHLSCDSDGLWKGTLPTCEPVDCGDPFIVPNSNMAIEAYKHGHLFKYGSIASYTCNAGYQLEGPSTVMCDANGRWKTTGRLPECKEKRCQQLPELLNANAHMSSAGRHQSAIVSCIRGYFLVGDSSMGCYLGQWKIANFTCLPVDCEKPPIPENAIISANEFTYGNLVTYSCAEGYNLLGNPNLKCGPDSLWLGGLPKCSIVDCGPPESLENGEIVYSSTSYLSSAEYSCERGYVIKGTSSRTCLGNGKWSGHSPQCHRISCPEPKPPTDGYVVGTQYFFGDSVQFLCKKGYVLRGNSTALCLDNAKWSAEESTCEAVMCQPPNPVPNTDFKSSINKPHPYETKIELGCQNGFIARGDMSSECQNDASWSQVKGRCSRMACGRPILKQNEALVVGRSYYYKDNVRFLCPPGSKLNGSSTAICLSTGRWSSTPSCISGCRRDCINGGVCVANNICSCPSGFSGDSCQKAICSVSCLNGGTCIGPFQCSCPPEFEGRRCEKPVCESGCGRGGRCIGPNVCLCRFGQTGPTCDGNRRGTHQETQFRDWDISAIRRSGWRN